MSAKHEFKVDVSHTILGRNILNLQERTVVNVLQSSGYTTGMFGKIADQRPAIIQKMAAYYQQWGMDSWFQIELSTQEKFCRAPQASTQALP